MEERQFIYLNVILGPLILVEGHRRLRGPALSLINTFCCVRYFARGYGRGATFSLSWLVSTCGGSDKWLIIVSATEFRSVIFVQALANSLVQGERFVRWPGVVSSYDIPGQCTTLYPDASNVIFLFFIFFSHFAFSHEWLYLSVLSAYLSICLSVSLHPFILGWLTVFSLD